MSMNCPFCRAEIPDDSRFCDQCGKELHFCPDCKKPKQGTKCAVCGADLIDAEQYCNLAASSPKPLFLKADGTWIQIREGVFGRTQGVYPEFSSDRYVSGRHGEFRINDGEWQICDLGSTNGTFLDGRRLETGVWVNLAPGHTVRIAVTTYSIE